MSEIKVKLPDGSLKVFPRGTNLSDVAGAIGPGLKKAALAAVVDGTLFDLTRTLETDSSVQFLTAKDPQSLEVIRHTAAHVLAMAVQKRYPGTQVTIGPVIEHGFYYDFLFPEGVKITDDNLADLEKDMQGLIKSDWPIVRKTVSRSEAIQTFKNLGEMFKVQIIEDLPPNEIISLYEMGGWFDLCRGPHLPSTGKVGAVKLTSVAGSYWRGDEKNARLTRIYGTAWATKAELEAYLHKLEEAKRRDHRVLGKQLGLFSFHQEAASHPFFHPAGTVLYQSFVDLMRRSNKIFGYQEVTTPLVLDVGLWRKSGHFENFRENMYFTKVDDGDAAIKPMNCPGHCLIYAHTRHSYRELPIRFSEFGRVHRHERSGVTHGLMRVRSFVQDDAHVFCEAGQIESEIQRQLEQIDKVYKMLGFTQYKIDLATRPEKYIGSLQNWDRAEESLKQALKRVGKEFRISPGEGAFYGPKIEVHLIDSLERSWQCGTIQLDFSMPERFELEYVGTDGATHTPVMIHRAVLGSLERFMGVYIEHCAGHFPIWATPVQVKVINVNEAQESYAKEIVDRFQALGLRVEGDLRNESLGYKIRDAQMHKVPYMVVVGEKERLESRVSVRTSKGDQLEPMSVDDFGQRVKSECDSAWKALERT